jgi:Pyruvate/2-oxoacid:ferredoxin oxidoreductase delta subunit
MRPPFSPKPSTRAYLKAARGRGMTLFERLHGYVYTRWCYLYIALAKGQHRASPWLEPLARALGRILPRLPDGKSFGQTFADAYHGKALPLDAAKKLITVNRDLTATLPEVVIPYAKARELVLENPASVAVLDCPCRSAAPNPCLPLSVCLIVGEPFVSMILEHHPGRSRRIEATEAVAILEAEDRRGHVHHAFFKDAMLGRFYAICNCCPCCCGAMSAHRNGIPMLASSGYVCRPDAQACVACGACVAACAFGALALAEDEETVRVDAGLCMGCGVCLSRCTQRALALVPAPERGQPLDVDRLRKTT